MQGPSNIRNHPFGSEVRLPIAQYDQSNAYVLEDFETEISNLVKELNEFVECNNMDEAVPRILRLAAVGHPQALYLLGRMHHLGDAVAFGIPKDLDQAMDYYKKAVENTEQKYEEAAKIAAPLAYLNMGCLYVDPQGQWKDYHAAVQCFMQAQELKSEAAGRNLIRLIQNPPAHFGKGVPVLTAKFVPVVEGPTYHRWTGLDIGFPSQEAELSWVLEGYAKRDKT